MDVDGKDSFKRDKLRTQAERENYQSNVTVQEEQNGTESPG